MVSHRNRPPHETKTEPPGGQDRRAPPTRLWRAWRSPITPTVNNGYLTTISHAADKRDVVTAHALEQQTRLAGTQAAHIWQDACAIPTQFSNMTE
jgi:anti-sigma factor RsiW